ncbi:MAG: hypothetical protein MRZ79_17390 [Bacteroidia bacterium]|nr:hypothetical protein [Bacteroidia bacterium]
MKINIQTPVKGNYKEVLAKFDRELFEKLSPPGADVELVRFDGSHKGDIVHIRLKLLGFIKQDWISEIVDEKESEQETFFVDRGTQLPFFLSYWEHRHIVKNLGPDKCLIIDDIEFRWHNPVFSASLYPLLYAQFAYRKPIYRKYFGEPDS